LLQALKYLSCALICCSAGALSAAAVSAQTPSSPVAGRASAAPSFAIIEGVVTDSLHRDYLRGAVLTLEGAKAGAVSDSLGRFRVDSIPPGAYRVEVVHPLLDTLGIRLRTEPLQLSAGQRLSLDISTPSAESLIAIKCTAGELIRGPGALLGFVQYAETEAPAVGARVSLDWVDYEVTSNSVRTVPRRRTATVAESGRFKICGLPADLAAELVGANASDTTSVIAFKAKSLVSLVALELPEPEPAAVAAPTGTAGSPAAGNTPVRGGKAVASGRVLDPNGTPLARARVAVDRDTAVALTGADGRFTLRGLRSGTRTLRVRRLGFEPAQQTVTLSSRAPVDVTVRLGELASMLDTIRITAISRDVGLSRVGFMERSKRGTGYYMTPEQISRRHAWSLPDLLMSAPMLRRSYAEGRVVLTGRPTGTGMGCLTYIVDGDRWIGGGVEDFIRPSEVAAIEIYSNNFTPGQFRQDFRQCETVVIWTKQKIGMR
jgi:hypothetical protein